MFGGQDSSDALLNDTWGWDGTNWKQLSPQHVPPASASASMIYDPTQRHVVLYAADQLHTKGRVWYWSGSDWIAHNFASAPSRRGLSAMADDPAHDQSVLFGGLGGFLDELADTWVWDGTNWTQVFPPVSPSARAAFSLVFDTARGQVVLFGGEEDQLALGDTWVWSQYPLTQAPLRGISGKHDLGLGPYTTEVNTVFDHSMADASGQHHIYGFDGIVTAFTDEYGDCSPAPSCGSAEGFYPNSFEPHFGVNGYYVGVGKDGGNATLEYEGHPGFDLYASCQLDGESPSRCQVGTGTDVYAVTSGTVHYPGTMVGLQGSATQWHVLELIPDTILTPDGVPYLLMFYMHLSTYPGAGTAPGADPTSTTPSQTTLPLQEGTKVTAGCLIAQSGNFAPPKAPLGPIFISRFKEYCRRRL